MPSTDQKRVWYPEIVLNHYRRCRSGYVPICDITRGVRVAFPRELGGTYNLLVHPKTREAFEAYSFLMDYFGETVPVSGGTHSCRNIKNTNCPSLHAYAVAIDLPPHDRKSSQFQAAVLRMRTNIGLPVWRNLASIGDRMHDEIDTSPISLASGIDWNTVTGWTGGDTLIIRQGATGNHIGLWKKALNRIAVKFGWNVTPLTGLTFDSVMRDRVATYQRAADVDNLVPELGALDDYTRDLLVEYTRDDG